MHHILKKCWKACMLLLYLCYTESSFDLTLNLIQASQWNISWVHKDIQDAWKSKNPNVLGTFYQMFFWLILFGWKARFATFTLVVCFLLPLKANFVLCSVIGSNSLWILILSLFIYNFIKVSSCRSSLEAHTLKLIHERQQYHRSMDILLSMMSVCSLARGTMTTCQNIFLYFHLLTNSRGAWVSSGIGINFLCTRAFSGLPWK